MTELFLPVRDYDLAATLDSGQAFRWQLRDGGWTGVISGHWVRLVSQPDGIQAQTARPVKDWRWLLDYLQAEADLPGILNTFPDDAPMNAAVKSCRGLRLLRQDPWECLASFIFSSTKQIVQIRQIVGHVCAAFGEPILVPPGESPQFAFPTPARIAQATETELRACKMGFRAPHLLAAARAIASGHFDLEDLHRLDYAPARRQLVQLHGVGNKIADCVLLFAYGKDSAFPIDVWIERALRELYFPRRRPSRARLEAFASTHFGPHAGFAQQYLFHYIRTKQDD